MLFLSQSSFLHTTRFKSMLGIFCYCIFAIKCIRLMKKEFFDWYQSKKSNFKVDEKSAHWIITSVLKKYIWKNYILYIYLCIYFHRIIFFSFASDETRVWEELPLQYLFSYFFVIIQTETCILSLCKCILCLCYRHIYKYIFLSSLELTPSVLTSVEDLTFFQP